MYLFVYKAIPLALSSQTRLWLTKSFYIYTSYIYTSEYVRRKNKFLTTNNSEGKDKVKQNSRSSLG